MESANQKYHVSVGKGGRVVGKGGITKDGGKRGKCKGWWEKGEVLRMVGKGGIDKDDGKRGKC